ncbi:unnamed protein product [Acanthoscelides obtectus]|uniref:Uncharacterized protein n=1 Tax=Acanthoscelides obtectus TaxID=200917 RepID=A0A9P0LQN0_ACAOB|nr:unnamed protein product [Acanthoscelides obtectus]CAK1672553.1 hypothetical protein AOBTE_LOCUS28961 [Acanthoscelides obtectus]
MKIKPKSRIHEWKTTNSNEIRTFIGLSFFASYLLQAVI